MVPRWSYDLLPLSDGRSSARGFLRPDGGWRSDNRAHGRPHPELDDRARFADARSLKTYAGSAPVTRASGRSLSVTHRWVKNDRLAAAGFVWAFAAAAHSPGASTLYYRRREHGDRHAAALRNVFNRLLGCLYHCLQAGQTYSEAMTFPTSNAQPGPATA